MTSTCRTSRAYQLHDSIVPNQLVVDWDGRSNAMFQWERDLNGLFSNSTHLDLNGDGHFDLASEDFNGDFWQDVVSWDVDGPGGQSYSVPTSSAGLVSFLDEGVSSGLDAWAALDTLTSGAVDSHSSVTMLDATLETSSDYVSQWSGQWHQQAAVDSCAVCCQEFIIEAATGKEITEIQVLNVARDLGVYEDGFGTSPFHMGAVLDHFGIENRVQDGIAFDELISLVNSGHGVSIAVESNEISGFGDWGEAYGIPCSGMNHAVQVTGFESNSSGDFVIINDPGHENGCASRVPIDQFLDAWSDSNNLACVTTERIV